MTGPFPGASPGVFGDQEVALVDLLDRLLAGGVVLTGDLTISLAGVDLVRLSLRALLVSIGADGPPVTGHAVADVGHRVPEVPG